MKSHTAYMTFTTPERREFVRITGRRPKRLVIKVVGE